MYDFRRVFSKKKKMKMNTTQDITKYKKLLFIENNDNFPPSDPMSPFSKSIQEAYLPRAHFSG